MYSFWPFHSYKKVHELDRLPNERVSISYQTKFANMRGLESSSIKVEIEKKNHILGYCRFLTTFDFSRHFSIIL